jgi:competence protein ComEC
VTEHDARTLPAALAAMVTCALVAGSGTWLRAASLLGLAAVAGFLVARRAVRNRRVNAVCRTIATACLLACVIAGIGAFRAATALPSAVSSAPEAGDRVSVRGVVVADARPLGPDAWSGVERYSVRLVVDRACAVPCAAPERARATVDIVTESAVPPLGAEVTATGVARESRDSRVALVLWGAEPQTTGREDVVLSLIGTAREQTRAQAQGLHPDVRDLTTGMVLGDTRAMPPALADAMRKTSLTHLTAVSGSHFAIVTLALGALLRTTVRRRSVRAVTLGVAMVSLTVFVGPDPSVQRALTMALAVAIGMWWGRPSQALPALGVGILVLLAIEPNLGASIGLQLSALAVVAIVVWAPRLRDLFSRWLLRSAATALAVPLAAWLACWPLLVTINPGLGPYAVPANLIAGLAAFPVTLIGLAGAVVGQAWPGAGIALLGVASWCAWPVVWAARSFSAAPGAWAAWPSGVTGVVLAAVVSALIAWGTMASQVRVAWRAGAAIAGVVVSVASPVLSAQVQVGVEDAAVVVCDVGQGDMTLVMAGDAEAVVIDTGPPGGAGADCLRRYGVTSIPLLILTHPHADHDGAIGEILEAAAVGEVWVSPVTGDPRHAGAVRIASRHGVPVSVPRVGDTAEFDAARIVVMGPETTGGPGAGEHELNDASIVVWVTAGAASALLLGDAESASQDWLARRMGDGVVVDLVKVAHHGSRIQSDHLAGAITARIAAVSVGERNSYGHPHPDTIDLYKARAAHVLTTSSCGDIVVTSSQKVAAQCLSSMAG